jgi:TonB family protein
MDTTFLLSNLTRYSLQVGLLIGLAAVVPTLLRLKLPAAKLAYWHILLAVCLTLPLLAPWQQEVMHTVGPILPGVLGSVDSSAPVTPIPAPRRYSPGEIALAVLAAGALIRLVWLGVGLWRLRGYRRASQPLVPPPTWGVEADLRVSEDVASPVTFGIWQPVVLLPAGFHELDVRIQDAVLAHECLHVRRRDWAFTIVEELVRAAFWFHPAIWWLLGEIQLAREQAVDRAAVEMTSAREEYVDALLAIAGASPKLDLAPAPLFLRKRHLKQRVVSLLKEVRMSKTRLVSALAAALCFMAVAGWIVTGSLPLIAAPQTVVDAPGVTVDIGSAALLHRSSVDYPAAALAKRLQGTVTLEVTSDGAGNVTDAHVTGGPDEFRKAALQSVLQWHFAHGAAGLTRGVTIFFKPPEVVAGVLGSVPSVSQSVTVGALGGVIGGVPAGTRTATNQGGVMASFPSTPLKSIEVYGLSETAKSELIASLPVHVGETMTQESLTKLSKSIAEFDEHLRPMITSVGDGWTVRVAAPQSVSSFASTGGVPPPQDGTQRIRVGGPVQAANLVRKVQPVYPPLAKQARISGKVVLNAVIGKDGTLVNLTVDSGHPLLVNAAIDAVRQWIYRPTMLNGIPVEVSTTIDINFTLAEEPPAAPVQ